MMIVSPQDWILQVEAAGGDAPEEARVAVSFARQHHAIDVRGRQDMLKWAAITCRCARRYDPDGDFPQRDCPVHGVVMITLDNKLL